MKRCGAMVTIAVLAGLTAATGPATAAPGPPLRTPVKDLEAALECSPGVARSAVPPVILVHGTTSTPEENFSPGYRQTLPRLGVPACTVRLPGRAMGDLQVSVERLVYAIRKVSALRGGKVSLLGHSQGGFHVFYALRYWPDLVGKVDDAIGLGAPIGRVKLGDSLCEMPCQPAFKQVTTDARFGNLFRAHPQPPGPSYTSIATLTDEIVFPQPESSHLDGGTNVVLQDICPGYVVDHFALALDGLTFAVAYDALTHAGPADPARIAATACTTRYMPYVTALDQANSMTRALAGVMAAQSEPKVSDEPPVRCYMVPACDSPGERGRMIATARVKGTVLVLRHESAGDVRVVVSRDGARSRTKTLTLDRVSGTRRIRLAASRPGRYRIRIDTKPRYYTRWIAEERIAFKVARG
jgi:triacylglycerol lipase